MKFIMLNIGLYCIIHLIIIIYSSPRKTHHILTTYITHTDMLASSQGIIRFYHLRCYMHFSVDVLWRTIPLNCYSNTISCLHQNKALSKVCFAENFFGKLVFMLIINHIVDSTAGQTDLTVKAGFAKMSAVWFTFDGRNDPLPISHLAVQIFIVAAYGNALCFKQLRNRRKLIALLQKLRNKGIKHFNGLVVAPGVMEQNNRPVSYRTVQTL